MSEEHPLSDELRPEVRALFERAVPLELSTAIRTRADEIARRHLEGGGGAAGALPLAPGDRLGPYQILRPLGSGGQACVYLARHVEAQWEVAIKVPHRHVAERLLAEARLTDCLRHPRIVSARDVRLEGEVPYLVMEHCARGSLQDLLDANPAGLPFDRVIAIGLAVLEALEYAHGQGVVHRDIKPANVLFDADGEVKVADFGIGLLATAGDAPLANTVAESLPGGAGATLFTRAVGTPAYMAPEQEDPALRVDGKVDARADLYAFGKLLYHMLTGRLPRTIKPVWRVRGDAVVEWDDIVFRLVEERPQDRFASAAEARAALERLAAWAMRPAPRETTPPAGPAARPASPAGGAGAEGRRQISVPVSDPTGRALLSVFAVLLAIACAAALGGAIAAPEDAPVLGSLALACAAGAGSLLHGSLAAGRSGRPVSVPEAFLCLFAACVAATGALVFLLVTEPLGLAPLRIALANGMAGLGLLATVQWVLAPPERRPRAVLESSRAARDARENRRRASRRVLAVLAALALVLAIGSFAAASQAPPPLATALAGPAAGALLAALASLVIRRALGKAARPFSGWAAALLGSGLLVWAYAFAASIAAARTGIAVALVPLLAGLVALALRRLRPGGPGAAPSPPPAGVLAPPERR